MYGLKDCCMICIDYCHDVFSWLSPIYFHFIEKSSLDILQDTLICVPRIFLFLGEALISYKHYNIHVNKSGVCKNL